MNAMKRPMPVPVASARDLGILRASHCRTPKIERNKKIHPSRNTAARASRYVMEPVPSGPTTENAKYAFTE